MITPRATRLVRAPDLQAFREAVITLACDGTPTDARDRLVIVPTRAAAVHLVRSLENQLLANRQAVFLPDFVTPADLVPRLAERLEPERHILTEAEREVLLGLACRAALESGAKPPFSLRAGLVAEVLRFFDALRLNQKDIDTFERLALSMFEPGAASDRGAERLVRQTRFLVAAFRDFERRCADVGVDDHGLRQKLLHSPIVRPCRHVIVAVGDHSCDPHGLRSADWDLLTRIPGLEHLDVVVTETSLAGALHERIHRLLPGIEEVHVASGFSRPSTSLGAALSESNGRKTPILNTPSGDSMAHIARDREEEVAGFARRTKAAYRRGELRMLDRAALVVRQPLPYVYIAREVLRSGGIPSQTFDALPLAAEPYAAALDLVFSAVSANFARGPVIALLRSPHFRFVSDAERLSWRDISLLDRALSERGYLGEIDVLEQLVTSTRDLPAGKSLLALARELAPLRLPASRSDHLSLLLGFLNRHESLPSPDDPLRVRQLRARGAILGILTALRDAYERFDQAPVEFDETSALVRRWLEGKTFAPRAGESGAHIVDAASAPFGDFDLVQLAGLVEGEWPDRPRRDIFYSPSLLRELGWPAEADRIEGARARFKDLLRLPAQRLTVSTFTLETDALVTPSPLLDEVSAAGLEAIEETPCLARIFEHEALGTEPIHVEAFPQSVKAWAALRAEAPRSDEARFHGYTRPHVAQAFSLSALERYQDCPFKFFASDVLRLEEPPEDESSLTPRARGRFIHEVFQRFFDEWDQLGRGCITPETIDHAREVMTAVAEPLLAKLPEADAGLERARLFGSAISVGVVDLVFGLEVTWPADVHERWLEYRLEGPFSLGSPDGQTVTLKGVADRIDLLSGNRLRVIDYKSGSAPNVRRALQVPIYALCAQERLGERDGVPWSVDQAAYVAFGGKRAFAPVVRTEASDKNNPLTEAKGRLFNVLAGIGRGEFPPHPHDPMICRYCTYSAVCRKDYVGDD